MNARVPAVLAFVATAAACHRGATAEQQGGVEMRGVVAVVGTSFDQHLQLESNGSVVRLAAAPADSAALTRLDGVEVAVRGTPTDRAMRVTSFRAVSVNGEPVIDGVVRVDGPAVSIETKQGRVRLAHPPTPLLGMNGARVWVSGPADTGPNNFGVIVPAR